MKSHACNQISWAKHIASIHACMQAPRLNICGYVHGLAFPRKLKVMKKVRQPYTPQVSLVLRRCPRKQQQCSHFSFRLKDCCPTISFRMLAHAFHQPRHALHLLRVNVSLVDGMKGLIWIYKLSCFLISFIVEFQLFLWHQNMLSRVWSLTSTCAPRHPIYNVYVLDLKISYMWGGMLKINLT